jgi:hypothetical protein
LCASRSSSTQTCWSSPHQEQGLRSWSGNIITSVSRSCNMYEHPCLVDQLINWYDGYDWPRAKISLVMTEMRVRHCQASRHCWGFTALLVNF